METINKSIVFYRHRVKIFKILLFVYCEFLNVTFYSKQSYCWPEVQQYLHFNSV